MAARRFEFSEGTSDKFWEIEITDKSFTVTYGRRGTAGQSSSKSFDSAEKAKAAADDDE